MLSIKFKRIGKKHQASFRVIVDEKRHKVSGRNVEDVGWYELGARPGEAGNGVIAGHLDTDRGAPAAFFLRAAVFTPYGHVILPRLTDIRVKRG